VPDSPTIPTLGTGDIHHADVQSLLLLDLDGGVPGAAVLFARRQASVLRPADLSGR
jgi:hypothetical protein